MNPAVQSMSSRGTPKGLGTEDAVTPGPRSFGVPQDDGNYPTRSFQKLLGIVPKAFGTARKACGTARKAFGTARKAFGTMRKAF
jgi:hypothetical protein